MAFLISDFLLPLGLLREVFESLAQHDVIPVIVGDASEDVDLPSFGLMELADLETGARRLVFMRPELKRRWLEAERERRAEIARWRGSWPDAGAHRRCVRYRRLLARPFAGVSQ